MLHYLVTAASPDPDNRDDIGCAIPYLSEGNVKLQVVAVYVAGGKVGAELARAQCDWYTRLLEDRSETLALLPDRKVAPEIPLSTRTCIVLAIENASGLCTEDEPMEKGLDRLGYLIEQVGRILYISLTHHGENRFGGGNTTSTGLKADGRALLEFLNGKGVALDLSHASDRLAYDSIDWIDKKGLALPILASHSNFRAVFDHARNLPDELAVQIIKRGGVIGINFLRAFMHPTDPTTLAKHIIHGYEIGGEKATCFGADFFCTKTHPDPSRVPFFFKEHEHAGKYQSVLHTLADELNTEQLGGLAWNNAARFVDRVWENKDK
jgi:microsomal dipeptidase-like Zn-dependent dipeptidase